MSSYDDSRPDAAGQDREAGSPARVGTVVWGLTVVALAALIIISRLGIVALNGTYVLIGLMIGAGAALIVGGLVSARRRDNKPTTGKS
jgi:xanthine/uracil permease